MSITVKARAIKEVFHRDAYYIIAFVPTQTNRDIQLNKYGNFSCCGEIGYITVGKEYELEVREGKASNYGISYEIVSVPSMKLEDMSNLTYEEKYDILMECTSSPRIAENILKAIPNYIEIALTQGEEAIDTSLIRGVGRSFNSAYCNFDIIRNCF